MYRVFLVAAAGAMLLASPASAHHPSGAGSGGAAGPIVTVPGTTLDRGESSAAVVFEYLRFNRLSDAQLGQPGHPHSIDAILAPSLLYSYGITHDLMLSLRLPYVRRTGLREGHVHAGVPEIHELGHSAGIGDVDVLGHYRFYNERAAGLEAALMLGIKAPTGSTHEKTSGGERFETEFQPGSGSWDGLFGLALTKRAGAWSFDGNVLYVLAREGAQSTDLGDRFQYNLAVSHRLIGAAHAHGRPMYAGAPPGMMHHGGPKARRHDHAHEEARAPRGPALDLVLELNGEWHARQEVAGVKAPNSGGNVVMVSPGVRLSHGALSAFLSVGIPIVNSMNGLQAETDYRILTGVAVSF